MEEQEQSKTYRITIKSLKDNFLYFSHVKSYKVTDGLLEFVDEKTKEIKRFGINNAEIYEEKGDNN